MSNRTDKPAAFHDASVIRGSKALELIMHDVLDGMQEFATLANLTPRGRGGYEILGIEPAAAAGPATVSQAGSEPVRAEVIPMRKHRSHVG